MIENLHDVIENTRLRFRDEYTNVDRKLPDEFKSRFRALLEKEDGKRVEYTLNTTVVTDSKGRKVVMPNQWFFIASYFPAYLNVFKVYKKLVMEAVGNAYPDAKKAKEFIDGLKDRGSRDEGVQTFKNILMNNLPSNLRDDEREEAVDFLVKFVTDYSWWKGNKSISRGDSYISPIWNICDMIAASSEFISSIIVKMTDHPELLELLAASETAETEDFGEDAPLQINAPAIRKSGGINEIIYGAPGTGKSRYLDNKYGSNTVMRRVIFHPEYTTYDFIGSYKPAPLYGETDRKIQFGNGQPFNLGEPIIDYRFVPGPFIKTLTDAWLDPGSMYTLVIEEINRANAASVFGEMFQLLDREPDGESEYSIEPGPDLKQYLESIPGMEACISGGLKIPSNLNLVATMNSADQGVSPMDAAFKRRWDFRYLKIDAAKAVHSRALLNYSGTQFHWSDFISAVNSKLISLGFDEDRLVGTYFVKPGEVGSSRATDKLLLYLWDDVLRYNRSDFFASNIATFGDLSAKFVDEDVLGLLDETKPFLSYSETVDSAVENSEESEEADSEDVFKSDSIF